MLRYFDFLPAFVLLHNFTKNIGKKYLLFGEIIHHAFFVCMYQVDFESFSRVKNSIAFFAGWHGYSWNHFDLMGLIEMKLSLD